MPAIIRPTSDPVAPELPPSSQGFTWPYVAYVFVHNIPLYLTLATALVSTYFSVANHNAIEDARRVQAYHETQLDSIGKQVGEVKTMEVKKRGPFD